MTDPLGPQTARGSPARLTAISTIKLPRWGMILLCLLYILPGLIGRDPWKSEDAIGFGIMWTMAEGRGFGGIADWLIPNVAGEAIVKHGPLMFWMGAVCIKLFAWLLGPEHAARLASVLVFFITATSIWYGTYLLGRRKAVQPLALAFGGQPNPRDYGRAIADGALLILLGTAGLLRRSHESSSDMAMVSMLSLALYALARSLDKPLPGSIWMGIALAGLALSNGPASFTAMLALTFVLIFLHQEWKPARKWFLAVALPLAAALIAVWPLLVFWLMPETGKFFDERVVYWREYFGGLSGAGAINYLKTIPWYTWLAWPIAAWAVWSWRKQMRAAHIALPGGYLLAVICAFLTTSDTSEEQLLMLLPGIVMLAGFGLPTLKRGATNAIDWFSLLVFSSAGVAVWFSWVTRMTGVPRAWAASIERQTPGLVPQFDFIAFLVALATTIGWFWIVRWRIVKHPKVLWRSVVLASGGLILVWILVNTLFLYSINYSRTYRGVALQIGSKLGAEPALHCVQTDGLGLSQRASFAYFAGVSFVKDARYSEKPAPVECRYLLRQDLTRAPRPEALPPGNWELIWEGRRASDKDERFRLYSRAP